MIDVKPSNLLLAKLAWCDLWYDRKVSFCIIASLISVIAPLLLLFSLKYGVVSQLREQLLNDPNNLEIKIIGDSRLNQEWFDWAKQQPEVSFVIPLTRSLSSMADLAHNVNGQKRFVKSAEVIPTEQGDPLVPFVLSQSNGVVLSALAAEKISAKKGDEMQLVITRSNNNKAQNIMVNLNVEAVLPDSAFSREAAFVKLPLLIAMEDFRDGFRSELLGNVDDPLRTAPRMEFAKARVYAKTLDDVNALAMKFRQKNLETRTQSKAIENVKAIDRVLSFIFEVIACTALIGCVLSLGGAFISNVERKRKSIALLRLLGFAPFSVVNYLVIQALCLSAIAYGISYLLYLLGSIKFNGVLGNNLGDCGFVSHLELSHLLIAFLIALALAALVSSVGAWKALKIQPAESLRDV